MSEFDPETQDCTHHFLLSVWEAIVATFQAFWASAAVTIEDAHKQFESALDSVIETAKAKVQGVLPRVKKQYKALKSQLQDAYAHERTLYFMLRMIELFANKRAPRYYWLLFAILEVSLILIFGWTYHITTSDFPLVLGILQAVTIAAPGYFLLLRFQHCEEKDRFLKRLAVIGLSVGIGMMVAAGILRAVMGNASLTYSTTSSWMDQLPFVCSAVMFIAAVGSEVCLSGALMILLYMYKSAKDQLQRLKEALAQVRADIKELEPKFSVLGEQLRQMSNFDDICNAFRASALADFVVRFKSAKSKAAKEKRDRIMRMSDDEILKLDI